MLSGKGPSHGMAVFVPLVGRGVLQDSTCGTGSCERQLKTDSNLLEARLGAELSWG